MANCSAGNCGICCPDGCGCISDAGNPNDCSCFCSGGAFEPGRLEWLTLDSRINFVADNLSLRWLGGALNCLIPDRLLIPADRVYHRITIKCEDMPCRDVLRECGVVVADEGYRQTKAG